MQTEHSTHPSTAPDKMQAAPLGTYTQTCGSCSEGGAKVGGQPDGPSLPPGRERHEPRPFSGVRSLVFTTRVGCRWMELGNGGIGSCNIDQKQKKGESRVGEAWSRSREHDKSPTPHLLWHLSRYLTAQNPRRRRPFTPPPPRPRVNTATFPLPPVLVFVMQPRVSYVWPTQNRSLQAEVTQNWT